MTSVGTLPEPAWMASIGQQRHFRYQQQFPGSAAFNVPVAATFRGRADLGALEAAIRAVTARHDVLRCRFALDGTVLRAYPQAASGIPVLRHDLTGCGSAAEQAHGLAAIGAAEAARPFRLAAEPATRAHLARLSGDEVALVLNVHHCSFDAWSSPLFFRELAACYTALTAGQPLPAVSADDVYADFAMAQRKRLRAGGYDEQLAYWVQELRDPAPAVRWPGDGTAAQAPWWAGDMAWASLPPGLAPAVQQAAKAARTTLFGWTLAVYKLALHRFLDAPAVAIGTPYSARTDRRWQQIIGFFANTLVMPSVFDPRQRFADLVRATHEQAIRGHRHQEVPYGLVVEAVRPETEPGRTPLFQTMFIVQNTPLPDPRIGPLGLRTTKVVTGSARYDLTFCLGWRRGQLALELETRPALLAQETAIRLAELFFGLLAASVQDPGAEVGTLHPVPVQLGVRRSRERTASVDGLFEGLVGDWRKESQ